MSEQTPYEQLGVSESASFEEIQAAKQRLSQQYQNNSQLLESIEAAYDAVIMDRLKLRKEGRIKVPERIRFPERAAEPSPNLTATPANNSPPWLQRLLDTPSRDDILWPALIFLGLAAATLTNGGEVSFLAMLMSLGGLVSFYFLNRKEKRFGRALLITLVTLTAGIALGSGLGTLLASGTTTLTQEQVACLVTFGLFWLSSSFLR